MAITVMMWALMLMASLMAVISLGADEHVGDRCETLAGLFTIAAVATAFAIIIWGRP